MIYLLIEKQIRSHLLIEQLSPLIHGSSPLDWWLEIEDGKLHLALPEGTDIEPIKAVLNAHNPADQSSVEILRSKVFELAQSAVGVRVPDLTNVQLKAVLCLLLYQNGMIDKDLRVLPLKN